MLVRPADADWLLRWGTSELTENGEYGKNMETVAYTRF